MAKTDPARSLRTRKIAVLAAGVLVVGLGATYTLASWTDSEWVFGGAKGNPNTPGIGTSTFNVQQNTSTDLSTGWVDEPDNPGGALTFGLDALSLAPGDTIFAPVSLRTVAGSVAGNVTLQRAVTASGVTTNDTNGALWDAIRATVYTSNAASAPSCSSADFDSADWDDRVIDDQVLATTAQDGQSLPAGAGGAAGEPQHYCFTLTLPKNAPNVNSLQGRTIAPAWEFKAVSE